MVIFGLGSIISATAPSIGVLIVGRIIQGVAGGVFPLAFGIINDEFEPRDRAVAIGVSVVFFLVFEIWFKVSLPKGPLEAALGLN